MFAEKTMTTSLKELSWLLEYRNGATTPEFKCMTVKIIYNDIFSYHRGRKLQCYRKNFRKHAGNYYGRKHIAENKNGRMKCHKCS